MSRIDPALQSGIVEETLVADGNGRKHRVVNWVVTPEERKQIEQGYRCPFDMQVFQEAFPEECPICAMTPARQWFSPRKHQADVFMQQFIGDHPYGPGADDFDYDREFHQPKSSVLLPGKDF